MRNGEKEVFGDWEVERIADGSGVAATRLWVGREGPNPIRIYDGRRLAVRFSEPEAEFETEDCQGDRRAQVLDGPVAARPDVRRRGVSRAAGELVKTMTAPTFTESMSVGLRVQLITEGWTPPCPEMRRFAALGMIADIRRQIEASDRVPVNVEVSPMAAEILLAESDALRGSDAGVPVRLAMNPGTVFSICDFDGHLADDEGMRVAVVFGRLKYAPPAANSNRPKDEELARQAESVLRSVRALNADIADGLPPPIASADEFCGFRMPKSPYWQETEVDEMLARLPGEKFYAWDAAVAHYADAGKLDHGGGCDLVESVAIACNWLAEVGTLRKIPDEEETLADYAIVDRDLWRLSLDPIWRSPPFPGTNPRRPWRFRHDRRPEVAHGSQPDGSGGPMRRRRDGASSAVRPVD